MMMLSGGALNIRCRERRELRTTAYERTKTTDREEIVERTQTTDKEEIVERMITPRT